MKKVFILDVHDLASNTEVEICDDIIKKNPDHILLFCQIEFDYKFIFNKFFQLITPYLEKTNKVINLIAPYIDKNFYNKHIVVEGSYGFYLTGRGTIKECIEKNIEFKFNKKTKLFTNYNNNNKYPRAMLVDQLVRYNLLKYGIVTLVNPVMRLPDNSLYEYKYHDGLALFDELDFKLNSQPKHLAGCLPKSYLNGLIDIASESTYDEGQFFITEKTTKPLGALKPFLVYGSKHVHKHLYEYYGIDYYDEWFDYSFDSCDSLEDRIKGIINNLLRLKNIPMAELEKMYNQSKPKMIKNRESYYNIYFDKNKYTPNTVKEIIQSEYQICGTDRNFNYFSDKGFI